MYRIQTMARQQKHNDIVLFQIFGIVLFCTFEINQRIDKEFAEEYED